MPLLTTEERIKNPNVAIFIKCSRCRKEVPVEQMLKEEPIPGHTEGGIDVALICPHCKNRRHSYYATEYLLFKQSELKTLREKWDADHIPQDFAALRRATETFKTLFDNTQKRLAAFVKKEKQLGRAKK